MIALHIFEVPFPLPVFLLSLNTPDFIKKKFSSAMQIPQVRCKRKPGIMAKFLSVYKIIQNPASLSIFYGSLAFFRQARFYRVQHIMPDDKI